MRAGKVQRRHYRFQSPRPGPYPMPHFMRIGRCEAATDWRSRPHRHEGQEWLLVEQGRVAVRIDDEEFEAGPGDFYFVQPGQEHAERSLETPLDFHALAFELHDFNGRQSFFVDPGHETGRQFLPDAGSLFLGDFRDIYREVWDNPPGCEEVVEALLLRLCWTLRRRLGTGEEAPPAAGSRRHSQLADAACRHIREHLREPFSLEALARHCRVSPDHLRHVFREQTGEPPLQYAQRLRMESAKRLLAETRLAVHEVATRLGFQDPYYFSRQFKKVTGLAPDHFRRRIEKRHLS